MALRFSMRSQQLHRNCIIDLHIGLQNGTGKIDVARQPKYPHRMIASHTCWFGVTGTAHRLPQEFPFFHSNPLYNDF